MKVTNLLFWCQDNTLSEKFYKKLGFERVEGDDQYTRLRLGGFEVVLITMRDEDEFAKDSLNPEKGRGMYVYLQVEDVDAEYTRQLKIGLKPSTEPQNWPWGNREFILKDPDGYKLVFWQKVGNS
ncbi:VOC family protein [Candidatus Saccharibacteria bacterium]|nr:VOC family protein [Candidatus Saccharibacteria bacterium]MCB9821282.1 VOC family protein [Candidatus Nomurabacteria bacterium]